MNKTFTKIIGILAIIALHSTPSNCTLLPQTSPTSKDQVDLIPRGAEWLFNDTGADLGADWTSPAYPDTNWLQGLAPFGYGEDFIQTEVSFGGDEGRRHVTTYLRQDFEFPGDVSTATGLFLRANYDDGLVIYLNGTEISRRAMPTGAIGYQTLALYHEAGAYEFVDVTASLGFLKTGQNTLAVEVHQQSASSSDLVVDVSLSYSLTPVAVTRGPYLQLTHQSGTTIRWRTHVESPSTIAFGPAPDALNVTVNDPAMTTEHEVQLTGLNPATRYYYALKWNEILLAGADDAHWFETAPLTTTSDTTRVWVLGDSGTADQRAATVRDAYLNNAGPQPTDIWLMLGDNAYNDGTDDQFQVALFDMYPSTLATSSLWATQGNHDDLHDGSNNDFFDFFSFPTTGEAGGRPSNSEAYYAFDWANIHFICLNTEIEDRSTGSPMLQWLAADLAATTSTWKIAFWHQPPYSDGSHNSDESGPMTDMRTDVLPILDFYGVDLVLAGHSHAYERSILLREHYGLAPTLTDSMIVDRGFSGPNGSVTFSQSRSPDGKPHGTIYVVLGSSGLAEGGRLTHPVMQRSLNSLGSLVLDVAKSSLRGRFLNSEGVFLDDFTINRPANEPVVRPGEVITVAPNPAHGFVQISYTLSKADMISLAIYNLGGHLLQTLVEGKATEGPQVTTWQGHTNSGTRVASGLYVVKLNTTAGSSTAKFIFLH